METHVLEDLAKGLRQLAAARDWDQFHWPNNLAMALVAAEAGELAADCQRLTEAESTDPGAEWLARIQCESSDTQH